MPLLALVRFAWPSWCEGWWAGWSLQ